MTGEELELVASLYLASADPEAGTFDIAKLIDDGEWRRSVEDLFTSDTHIKFVTPPGRQVSVMDPDEFRGLSGMAEGWRVWMQPWESFVITPEDLIDAGAGRILFLAQATARIRDSGTEITQETGVLHLVEGGKIVAIHYFLDQDQAREEAGLA